MQAHMTRASSVVKPEVVVVDNTARVVLGSDVIIGEETT
jgi:hypothetical protein